MKIGSKISPLSVTSLCTSLLSLISFALLFETTGISKLIVRIAWNIFSPISLVLPIAAKYYRKSRGARGRRLEIAALVIGAFFCDTVLVYEWGLKYNIDIAVVAAFCVLYAKSFNHTEPPEAPKNIVPNLKLINSSAEVPAASKPHIPFVAHSYLLYILGIAILAISFSSFLYIRSVKIEAQKAYDNGYYMGRKAGYDEGRSDGYDSGYDIGHSVGLHDGREDGYNQGFDKGYVEALSDSEEEQIAYIEKIIKKNS